jgi:hypothetical protein
MMARGFPLAIFILSGAYCRDLAPRQRIVQAVQPSASHQGERCNFLLKINLENRYLFA